MFSVPLSLLYMRHSLDLIRLDLVLFVGLVSIQYRSLFGITSQAGSS